MQKIGFFEEDVNVKSSTRLNSFLLLLFFIGFNIMWLYGKNSFEGNFLLFNALVLVGVFAPKYLHKIVESKFNSIENKNNEEIKKDN
jgi:hypothetical protein